MGGGPALFNAWPIEGIGRNPVEILQGGKTGITRSTHCEPAVYKDHYSFRTMDSTLGV